MPEPTTGRTALVAILAHVGERPAAIACLISLSSSDHRFDLTKHKIGGRFERYPIAGFKLSGEVSDVF
jgi:hypothetical protein